MADSRGPVSGNGRPKGEEQVGTRVAVTRPPTAALRECALTHLARRPIDVNLAVVQHAGYEAALRELGFTVVSLPPEPDLPDAVFVEDVAVVLDEVAVVARPGAESRAGEVESVAAVLARYRPLARLPAAARLDGGDVLRVGRTLYVGVCVGGRTNAAGVAGLAAAAESPGYRVEAVPFGGCLHLKTAVSHLGGGRLLVNRDWVDPARFAGLTVVGVDAAEPFAANVLALGNTVLCPAGFPAAEGILRGLGLTPRPLDLSELQKAEAGSTCMSLLIDGAAG